MSKVDEQKAALPAGPEADAGVDVQASALRELADGDADGAMGMAALVGVPVGVTVEVGRTSVNLGELCKLGPGSLVRLDREAHQPADILVNGKVVARGEIVTVDGCYGVRITDLG
jgi:flagellar motor switch protein FliN/FliY